MVGCVCIMVGVGVCLENVVDVFVCSWVGELYVLVCGLCWSVMCWCNEWLEDLVVDW